MWRRDPLVSADQRRWARWVTVGSTALFALVLCRWRPWTLFERGGFTTDFYDVQATAFLHLRLDVPADVAGIEGFSIDGKTYLYYGPFLAIARMPFALFGGWADGRLTRISMVVAFACLCTVAFHLARRAATLVDAAPGAAWRPALLIAALALSPVLALAGRPSVYHETELWALVFILATFVALIDVLREPSTRALALAAGAAIAAVMTRASIGFGALAALALTGAWLLGRDRRRAIAAIGTAVAGVVAYIAINLAKFGTLLDLPADRQVLTLLSAERAEWFAGNDGSFFGLRFLPTTIVQYVRPDAIRLERLVPFVRFGPRADEFGSYPLESNTPSSSLTSTATLLVVMALVGFVLFVRGRHWRITPLLAGAAVAAGPTLAIGFVANRYLVDLLPLLAVPAALAAVHWHVARRTAAIAAVLVLAAWGAAANTALAVWQDGIDRPGFTASRYQLDRSVFGGAPPSVIDLDPARPVPRDGMVAIDGECDGLYIASQGVWVPLEQAAGVRRLQAELDPAAGPGVLTNERGDAITIGVAPAGNALFVLYEGADGATAQGSVETWNGGPVDVEVTSDPVPGGVTGGLSVLIEGEQALFALAVPDLTSMIASDAFVISSPADRGTPICADLAARR
jgi:hypothetical protein